MIEVPKGVSDWEDTHTKMSYWNDINSKESSQATHKGFEPINLEGMTKVPVEASN